MITVKNGVFHLQNEENSYLFRIMDGYPEHLHFGGRVETADAEALTPIPGCGWGGSLSTMSVPAPAVWTSTPWSGAVPAGATSGKARWSCRWRGPR